MKNIQNSKCPILLDAIRRKMFYILVFVNKYQTLTF